MTGEDTRRGDRQGGARRLRLLLLILAGLAGAGWLAGLTTGYRFRLGSHLLWTLSDPTLLYEAMLVLLAGGLWFSAPAGLTLGGRLDQMAHALTRWAAALGRGWLWEAGPEGERQWRSGRVVALLCALLGAYLYLAPAYRYLCFGGLADFEIFVESVASGARGEPLLNHFHFWQIAPPAMVEANPTGRVSLLSSHFQPFLFVFVPFYRLLPSPHTLLVLQALIFAAAPWAFFKLARPLLGRDSLALAATLCLCLYPSLLAATWSFFPDTLSLTFLLWAMHWERQGRRGPMLLMLLLTISTKEMMAVPVAMFGAYIFLARGRRALGAAVAVLALAWLLVCLHLVIPAFSPAGGYHFTGALFGQWGSSLPGLVWGLLSRPWEVVAHLWAASTLAYLGGLLLPLAGLPLASLRVWAYNLPLVFVNLMASPACFWCRWPAGHLSTPLTPFTALAFLTTLGRWSQTRPAWTRRALLLCLLAALACAPISDIKGGWSDPVLTQAHRELERLVKPGEMVATNLFQLWSRLEGVVRLERFPLVGEADWIVVEFNQPHLDEACGRSQPLRPILSPRDGGQPVVGQIMGTDVKALCPLFAGRGYRLAARLDHRFGSPHDAIAIFQRVAD